MSDVSWSRLPFLGEEMDVKVTVTAVELSEEMIAEATRELLKIIRSDADPRARLVTQEAPIDSKGAAIVLGQIVLALVTGGAVKSFIKEVFQFLGRHRRIKIEVQNATGKKLKLEWDYVDRHGEEKAIALVETFLTQSK